MNKEWQRVLPDRVLYFTRVSRVENFDPYKNCTYLRVCDGHWHFVLTIQSRKQLQEICFLVCGLALWAYRQMGMGSGNTFPSEHVVPKRTCLQRTIKEALLLSEQTLQSDTLTLILRRSRKGTVWFYTSASNKRAARPKLYTKSLTRDLKLMYSRLTLVRISINL